MSIGQQIMLDEHTAVMQLNLSNSLVSRALKGAIGEMSSNPIKQLSEGKTLTILGEPGPIVEHRTEENFGVPMAIVYHNGEREKAGQFIESFLKYWGRMPTWEYNN